MSEIINGVKVFIQPVRIVFCSQAGCYKAGSIETLNESVTDNIAVDEKRELPNGRSEPFFTKAEVVAAKRALAEQKIEIA